MRLTIDPLEFRGYRYHTGLALTLFAPGRHEELGRGGRYFSTDGEPATGITLYADAALRAATPPAGPARIYVPAGTLPAHAQHMRAAGYATAGRAGQTVGDAEAEARRMKCSHVLVGDAAVEIKQ